MLAKVAPGPGSSAWAAGDSCMSGCGGPNENDRTLILCWNGTAWTRAPSPSPGTDAELWGVTAAAGGSAWAAGDFCTTSCLATHAWSRTLILRWT